MIEKAEWLVIKQDLIEPHTWWIDCGNIVLGPYIEQVAEMTAYHLNALTAERDEAVRERDELRAALKGLDLHYNSVMGLIKPMFGYQQYYWDKLIKEPKDAIRAALDALTTDKASAGGEA